MLHIFVLSYTYKIVSITSGIYLKTSRQKKNALSFFFVLPICLFQLKFYLRLLLNSHITERCMFSHIYFFIKSTFSIPVSTGKMKNKLSRFGELNYPSFFPASRSQFLISPLSNSYATFHTQGEFNFEFSLEILFSIPCCINSSMPLQSLCGWVPKSLGFSKQEHWNGLPFPSPMHGSEK